MSNVPQWGPQWGPQGGARPHNRPYNQPYAGPPGGYYYHHPALMQRRRRRGPAVLLVMLLGLFAVVAVGLAIAVGSLLNAAESGSGTFSQPEGPSQPAPSEPSEPPTPRTPTKPGSDVAITQDNAFYQVGGLSQVDCPAPSLADSGTEAQRAYDEKVFACLVQGWEGALRKANFSTKSPEIFVFDGTGTSPCGTFRPATGRILAFYCPANRTMYADVRQMAKVFPSKHHIVYALVLAHEYGHHLQNMAGILQAESRLAYDEPDREAELSRRTETQASCFAGIFVRSIAQSYPVSGEQGRALEFYAYRAFGDPEDAADSERSHGSPQSQGTWIERGYSDNNTASCNTYAAPPDQVD